MGSVYNLTDAINCTKHNELQTEFNITQHHNPYISCNSEPATNTSVNVFKCLTHTTDN